MSTQGVQHLPALPIPQAHHLIMAAGRKYGSIGAEGYRLNLGAIGVERVQQLTGLSFPQPHRLIQAPAYDNQAGCMKADRCNACRMAGKQVQPFSHIFKYYTDLFRHNSRELGG